MRTSDAAKSCRTAVIPAPATIAVHRGGSTTPAGGWQDAGVTVGSAATSRSCRQVRNWASRRTALAPEPRRPRRCDRSAGATVFAAGAGLAAEQREEDHADHRDADRVAELEAGVEHAGGGARVLVRHPVQHDVGQRRDHGTEAEARADQAGHQFPGGHRGTVVMHGHDQAGHPGGDDERTDHRDAAAEPGCEPGGGARGDQDAQREREEGQPGVQRGEAQAKLQEQGQHQPERGDPQEERHRDGHAHAELTVAEQPQRHQR